MMDKSGRWIIITWLIVVTGLVVGSAIVPQAAHAVSQSPAILAQTGDYTLYLPLTPRSSVKESIFGVEVSSISKGGGAYDMQTAGAYWFRLNGLLWRNIEPNPGERNWDAVANLSNQLKDASQRGLRVILIIRGAPAWARLDVDLDCSGVKPESYQAFATFVQDVVKHFSQPPYNVQYFEIWNEPDVDPDLIWDGTDPYGCWGDAGDYYYGGRSFGEMLKVVYPKVRDVNQTAQIIFGGLLLDCNPASNRCASDAASRYLEGALYVGAGSAFDILSFHGYDYFDWDDRLGHYENSGWMSTWNTTGPVSIAKAKFLRDVLNRFGVGSKPLINTETALITNHEPCSSDCQQTKAYYVVQSYAVARSIKLLTNVWYSALGWRGSELFSNDGTLTPQPAYYAYEFAHSKLSSGSYSRKISDYNQIQGYEFYDGVQRWVLWAKSTTPQEIQLPKTPLATYQWDAATSRYIQVANNRTVTIGMAPMFFDFTP